MRKLLSVAAVCALLPAALAAGADSAPAKGPPAAARARKVRVAVLGLRSLGGDDARAGQLSEAALREASAIAGLAVIGKPEIVSAIGAERQQQMLGCGEEPSCLADLGGALGADYLLLGTLGQLGGLFRIELKVVDTLRTRLVARASDSGTEERLVPMVQRTVRQLLEPIANPAPPSSAAPPSKGPRREASPPPDPAPRSSSSWSR